MAYNRGYNDVLSAPSFDDRWAAKTGVKHNQPIGSRQRMDHWLVPQRLRKESICHHHDIYNCRLTSCHLYLLLPAGVFHHSHRR